MNKKLKKFLPILLSSLLVSSVFIGCGKSNETTEKKENVAVTETKSTAKYVDDSYITDAKWLSENLKNKDVLILDARGDEAYNKSHITGAISTPWQSFSNMEGKSGDKGWGVILDANNLSEKLSKIGVDENKTIVVYSDTKDGWGDDGRIVWMLRMAGIENTKMLNGGFNFWENNKFETSTEVVTPTPSNLKITELNKAVTIDTTELNNKIGKVKILDSRDKSEFDGAVKFGESRGGHIPTAINLPFKNVLNEDGTFKSADELDKIFKDAGLAKDDEIVTYCTAGIRSAHLVLALKMMGYDNAKNYDESFYTWAKDESLKIEK